RGQALPTGADVVAGSVGVSTSGASMTVTQSSGTAIVNWDSFSIGAGGSVHFAQPGADAVILNRVTGGLPSVIAGALTANGQVFLVNAAGIAVTATGIV